MVKANDQMGQFRSVWRDDILILSGRPGDGVVQMGVRVGATAPGIQLRGASNEGVF